MLFAHTPHSLLPRAALLLLLGLAPAAQAESNRPPGGAAELAGTGVAMPSWSPLVKRVLPAVVNVAAEIPVGAGGEDDQPGGDDAEGQGGAPPPSFNDFLRRYLEQHGPTPGAPLPHGVRTATGGKILSVGSAFIIDPSGLAVTNNHVVARATKIMIIFSDNSRHLATVVGTDPNLDIALLKVSVKRKLPFLQWGDSDRVETGDWVLTVGNPFGLGGTVTAGIVSALGRDLQQGPFDDFLQIDAPINRGSSGGPTLDTAGRVVGVNAAIYSPTGGSVGIGFAIPANLAKAVVEKLRESGHADHGYLGIGVQLVTADIARALHMDPDRQNGLLVNDVDPDSPAGRAGILVGDVITEANGHRVLMSHDISTFVVTAKLGDRLRLTVDRNNIAKRLEVIVGRAPSRPQAGADNGTGNGESGDPSTVMGMWFAALSSDMHRELKLNASVHGVVIGGIEANSAAAAIGLMPGDVVMSIDRQPVTQPAEATEKLRAAADQGEVLLLVDRQGNSHFMVLPAPGTAEHDLP